jgi:hypothetical protein
MAFPGTYNFNYYRGDTAEFVVRPKNTNGTTFDLTGYTGSFTIANRRGSSGSQIIASASVNSETDTVTCSIIPNTGRELASGTYVYDVQIANGLQIYTLVTGTITVTDDVTGAVV